MGASAVKLLVYYHPDAPTAGEIENFVRAAGQECARQDMVLMLEPLSYALDGGGALASDEKRRVVLESARRLTPLGVDILKAEFPLDVHEPDEARWAEACRELSTCSAVPWILLSAGVDFETFLRQVMVACRAGASGTAVGRAVWKEAVSMPPDEREKFLRTVGRQRLSRLTSLCHALARPYTELYQAEAPLDWYKNYGG